MGLEEIRRRVQRIGGDFAGGQLSGPVNLEGIGGDANLQIDGGELRLRSGGDINLMVLNTTGLSLRADAGARGVHVFHAQLG